MSWELRQQIVDVLARFPWWGLVGVAEYLQEQGLAVTYSQVQQAAQDVGWQRFKQTLRNFFVASAESIRPRETGLVQELMAQVDNLLEKVAAGAGLSPEQQLEISHLQTIASELGLIPPPPPAAIPWAQNRPGIVAHGGSVWSRAF